MYLHQEDLTKDLDVASVECHQMVQATEYIKHSASSLGAHTKLWFTY